MNETTITLTNPHTGESEMRTTAADHGAIAQAVLEFALAQEIAPTDVACSVLWPSAA